MSKARSDFRNYTCTTDHLLRFDYDIDNKLLLACLMMYRINDNATTRSEKRSTVSKQSFYFFFFLLFP